MKNVKIGDWLKVGPLPLPPPQIQIQISFHAFHKQSQRHKRKNAGSNVPILNISIK